MPTFDAAEFPTDAIFSNNGCIGGPSFADTTSLTHSNDGSEQRNSTSRHARRRFTINTDTITDDLREEVFDFFEARRGRSDSFLFLDPFDYEATSEPIVSGQLVKRYTCGSTNYDRPVTKPKSGTVTYSGGGTLDYATGIISGGSGGTWSGQFHTQCRFDTDHYQEVNYFEDWHEVSLSIVEAVDMDYPALASSALASTITYTFPLYFSVGRQRFQDWSTDMHEGGGYSEFRETRYSGRKAGYAGTVGVGSKADLELLISLFLCVRGPRTAFQYETLDVRFGNPDLRIRTVGTNAYECDIRLVEA